MYLRNLKVEKLMVLTDKIVIGRYKAKVHKERSKSSKRNSKGNA